MILMGDKRKAITAFLGPDSQNVSKEGEEEGPGALEALGQEAMECIQAKDSKGFVEAMRALFEEFDSQPHEEGPHL